MEAIASRLETIASRLEVIAIRFLFARMSSLFLHVSSIPWSAESALLPQGRLNGRHPLTGEVLVQPSQHRRSLRFLFRLMRRPSFFLTRPEFFQKIRKIGGMTSFAPVVERVHGS